MNDRVPDLLVEQLALDELPPEQARRVQAQLEDDDDPRLSELRRSDDDILEAHPPEIVARRIRNRLQRVEAEPASRRPGWWFVTATLAGAAAVALAWWIARPDALVPASTGIDGEKVASLPQQPDVTRIKGDPRLMLTLQDGARTTTLGKHDRVAPGDSVLVSYRADTEPHGVIVSLDGAGEVTLHFPADETQSTALKPNGTVRLHAFELDDAPAFERFFFVTATDPLDVAQVMESVRALGHAKDPLTAELSVPREWRVKDFPLVRQPR
jgi:hypothetical protein